jgi:hypothetical protein
MVSCGGKVAVEGDGGVSTSSQGAGSGSSAGEPGTGFAVCPPDPPAVGESCDLVPPNNGCRYYLGTLCQGAFVCQSGSWQTYPGGC